MERDQYNKLCDFRHKIEEEGFYCTYSSESEFSELAYRQISNLVSKEILTDLEFSKFLKKKDEDSSYDVKIDYDRLETQADLVHDFDMSMINLALRHIGKQDISVLDIGCGSGYVTQSRFSIPEVSSVLAIDKSNDAISKANSEYSDPKFSFVQMDVSEKLDINQTFDLIFCGLTLHHIGNWEALLRRAWSLLNDDGVIVIRTPDDGLKLSYPRTAEFQELLDLSREVTGGSDRIHGRKIYTCAKRLKPAPTNIEYKFNPQTVTCDDQVYRKGMFEDNFSYRGNYVYRLAQESPHDKAKQEFARSVQRKTLELQRLFVDEEQFFVSIDIGVVICK